MINETILTRFKKAIMSNQPINTEFYSQIIDLLQNAKSNIVRAVNSAMVSTYFEIGRIIVEEEQDGNNRATYGKNLLKGLSKALTNEFGKGFSVTNLQQMRNFYLTYRKQQTSSVKSDEPRQIGVQNQNEEIFQPNFDLSWSHYLTLIRLENKSIQPLTLSKI